MLTGEAFDSVITTVWRVIEQVEHALDNTRFKVSITEEGLQIFQFLKKITKECNENSIPRNRALGGAEELHRHCNRLLLRSKGVDGPTPRARMICAD